jgi:hypothetical protein
MAPHPHLSPHPFFNITFICRFRNLSLLVADELHTSLSREGFSPPSKLCLLEKTYEGRLKPILQNRDIDS